MSTLPPLQDDQVRRRRFVEHNGRHAHRFPGHTGAQKYQLLTPNTSSRPVCIGHPAPSRQGVPSNYDALIAHRLGDLCEEERQARTGGKRMCPSFVEVVVQGSVLTEIKLVHWHFFAGSLTSLVRNCAPAGKHQCVPVRGLSNANSGSTGRSMEIGNTIASGDQKSKHHEHVLVKLALPCTVLYCFCMLTTPAATSIDSCAVALPPNSLLQPFL